MRTATEDNNNNDDSSDSGRGCGVRWRSCLVGVVAIYANYDITYFAVSIRYEMTSSDFFIYLTVYACYADFYFL